MIAVRMTAVLAGLGLTLTAVAAGFPDVGITHPHLHAIGYVQQEGIVSGYPDGTFRPDASINRAEFTKIIVNAKFKPIEIASCLGKEQPLFPDVSPDAWFAPYVCVAKEENIVAGYPDGFFRPEQTINVAEAAKILAGAFALPSAEESTPWYRSYINALSEAHALPLSLMSIRDPLTRGQMAEMVYRLDAVVITEATHTYESLRRLDSRFFDTATVQNGETVGGMTVQSIQRGLLQEDAGDISSIRFTGDVVVLARYQDMRQAGLLTFPGVCVGNPDPASLWKIPVRDGRAPGFCTKDPALVDKIPAGSSGWVWIRIGSLTRYLIDGVYDEAELLPFDLQQIRRDAVTQEECGKLRGTWNPDAVRSVVETNDGDATVVYGVCAYSNVCVDPPEGNTYPVKPEYASVGVLGSVFTAFECGEPRASSVFDYTIRQIPGFGLELHLKAPPTSAFAFVLEAQGYECVSRGGQCTQFVRPVTSSLNELLDLRPYMDEIDRAGR